MVFTQDGRYYFHDTVEGYSKWRPPEHLLEYLLEMPPEKLANLFNRDEEYVVEQFGEIEMLSEEDYIVPSESESEEPDIPPETTTTKSDTIKKMTQEEQLAAVEGFKEMLLDSNIDAFQQWSTISSSLSEDPRFQAVQSEKERRAIFESMCPQLAEKSRAARKQRMETAERSWKSILEDLTLVSAPSTWTEFSRHVKREAWYKLLDQKRMEREYRERLKDLSARSRVYQIPK